MPDELLEAQAALREALFEKEELTGDATALRERLEALQAESQVCWFCDANFIAQ